MASIVRQLSENIWKKEVKRSSVVFFTCHNGLKIKYDSERQPRKIASKTSWIDKDVVQLTYKSWTEEERRKVLLWSTTLIRMKLVNLKKYNLFGITFSSLVWCENILGVSGFEPTTSIEEGKNVCLRGGLGKELGLKTSQFCW